MRKPGPFGVALGALVLAAAGCGFISNFVPPQEVGDVFGIGTPEAPTTITAPRFEDPARMGPLRPANVGAVDYDTTLLTFDDIEVPDLRGFSIDALWVTIGFGDTVTLERGGVEQPYPDSFTLTSFEAYLRVSDEVGGLEPVTYHFAEKPLALAFERVGACTVEDASCTYKAEASEAELRSAMLFHIPERDGQVTKRLFEIVRGGGDNEARIRVRLTADSPDGDLIGFAPTFRIMNTSTKVSLGG